MSLGSAVFDEKMGIQPILQPGEGDASPWVEGWVLSRRRLLRVVPQSSDAEWLAHEVDRSVGLVERRFR